MTISTQRLHQWGRAFYLIAIGAIGIQQLCYGNLVNFIGPAWPTSFPGYTILVYAFSLALIILAIAGLANANIDRWLVILGITLLVLDACDQVPWLYLVFPHNKTHVGVWVHVLKELALAGGAFIASRRDVLRYPGALLFSTTMAMFGWAHFLYAEPTATLVPSWIPGAMFWVYFAGSALIAAAIAIVTRILPFWAPFLLGTMIIIWFVIIHIPGALRHFGANEGNEISAAFSALAFSGIAFMICARK